MTTIHSEPAKKSVASAWAVAASCLTFVLSCAIIYANSRSVPFLFDDAGTIVRNPTIRSLGDLKQDLSPPANGETVQGRPLLNLSFAANYAWTGLDVWSWHAVNVAIHALAGICLFGIVRQTLLLPGIPEQQQRRATWLAFAAALLWTVHPLQTESVTYIVQRAESLVGLLLLLTLYCSIRGAVAGGSSSAWQVAAVLASLAGMAVKEVMVAAPLLVVLYDWAFRGDSLVGTLKRRWRFYVALASTWLVLAALVFESGGRGSSAGFGRGVTSWEYFRTQPGFLILYLKLSVWPYPLVLDYGDRITPVNSVSERAEIIAAGMIVALLLGTTLAALFSRRYRPLGFLGAWFFCILAPSSSIVPVLTQTGAEHRMYLPLATIVVLFVVAVDRFCEGARSRGITAFTVVCGAALVLALLTVRRNEDYKTALSIWRDTAQKCPENWRAQASVADAFTDAGDLNHALAAYDSAIRLAPHRAASFINRGVAHQQLGHLREAISDFQNALEIDPGDAGAQFNLGIALTFAGRLEQALAALNEAARIDPDSSHVYWRRGMVLMQMARRAEAIEDFTTAIRLRPQFDKPFHDRGLCYRATGRLDEAIADFSKAIAINANEAFHYLDRGVALEMAGQYEESVRDCSTAIRLRPGFAPAYHARAVSYVDLGSFDLARADLAQLQRLGAGFDPKLLERIDEQQAAAQNSSAGK
jgi:tetratricopeptide (TPR) repeat protein